MAERKSEKELKVKLPGEEKVHVNVALPLDEYLRLEEAVVRKFGRKKGAFSVFVREAIRRAVDEVLQEKT